MFYARVGDLIGQLFSVGLLCLLNVIHTAYVVPEMHRHKLDLAPNENCGELFGI